MRKLFPLVAAALVTLAAASVAVADTVPAGLVAQTPVVTAAAAPAATYAPLGMGLSVIGVGIGLGLIGLAAMGGIARQPEQADNIRGAMILIGGLVEGAGIVGLVLCLATQFL